MFDVGPAEHLHCGCRMLMLKGGQHSPQSMTGRIHTAREMSDIFFSRVQLGE